MADRLKILLASAEVVPFSKVGGLADVAGALPKALAELGLDVRVVTPNHMRQNKVSGLTPVGSFSTPMGEVNLRAASLNEHVPVYLVENSRYFDRPGIYSEDDDLERYLLFSRAVFEVPKSLGWQPDIYHCNDWHTAIVPLWLKALAKVDPFYARSASILTVHNLAYQGVYERERVLRAIREDVLAAPFSASNEHLANLMREGLRSADAITTVSKRYAQEIQTREYGEGLDYLMRERKDRLFGIINGLDYEELNPATDRHLVSNYDVSSIERKADNKAALQRRVGLPERPGVPVIGMVSRLADQKGLDILQSALHDLVTRSELQLVILGTGEQKYHDSLKDVPSRYPGKVAIVFAFDAALAQLIYAGSDMFIMPSRFEPCGLGQLMALRYGTIPVVRHTGGLVDTITDYNSNPQSGNGFAFTDYSPQALLNAVERAVTAYRSRDEWRKLIVRGMESDFSWDNSARQYEEMYRRIMTSVGA